MNIRKLMISTAAAFSILTLTAFPILASVGTQNPNLTVQLTLNPTVVTAPGQVTAIGSIKNNTGKTDRVVAQVKVTSPSAVTTAYSEKYIIVSGETISETIVYSVPATAQKGVYTVTLSATDKAGTSSATEYLTVQ